MSVAVESTSMKLPATLEGPPPEMGKAIPIVGLEVGNAVGDVVGASVPMDENPEVPMYVGSIVGDSVPSMCIVDVATVVLPSLPMPVWFEDGSLITNAGLSGLDHEVTVPMRTAATTTNMTARTAIQMAAKKKVFALALEEELEEDSETERGSC